MDTTKPAPPPNRTPNTDSAPPPVPDTPSPNPTVSAKPPLNNPPNQSLPTSPYQSMISETETENSLPEAGFPSPPEANAPKTVTATVSTPKKSPLKMVGLLLILGVLGFAGSLFFFRYQPLLSQKTVPSTPQVTPQITYTPTEVAQINPINSPTPAYSNPFASPTIVYENPFGEYENPFTDAEQTTEGKYVNPFEELKE